MTKQNDFWRMCKRSYNTSSASFEASAQVCRWKMSCTVRDTTRTDSKMCVRQGVLSTLTVACTTSLMPVREIWRNSTISQSVARCFLVEMENFQIFASHQLKSEPVDHLFDVILIPKVELTNRCIRSFAIQCVRLLDLVLATTMLVLWMKMTRAVAMLTMLPTNFGFAIPGQLSTARRWVCVEIFHVLVWRGFAVLLEFVNL